CPVLLGLPSAVPSSPTRRSSDLNALALRAPVLFTDRLLPLQRPETATQPPPAQRPCAHTRGPKALHVAAELAHAKRPRQTRRFGGTSGHDPRSLARFEGRLDGRGDDGRAETLRSGYDAAHSGGTVQ